MVCIRNILKELYVPWGSSFGTNAIVRAFIRYAVVRMRVRMVPHITYAMVTHDHVLLLLRLEMNFPDIFQISHHM